MAKILGGAKSRSSSQQDSYNQAFEPVSQAFNPLLKYADQGAKGFADLMGGDTTGLNQYKANTGFDFAMDRGVDGVYSGAAGRRTLQSGAAAKGVQAFGSGLQQQYNDSYLDKMLKMAQLGFGAGESITGAGAKSTGSSKAASYEGEGILGGLSKLGGMIAMSDRRLKKDVEKIGELPNGLGIYSFSYNHENTKRVGVMADEVAVVQPEALGPVVDGYQSVDYALVADWN